MGFAKTELQIINEKKQKIKDQVKGLQPNENSKIEDLSFLKKRIPSKKSKNSALMDQLGEEELLQEQEYMKAGGGDDYFDYDQEEKEEEQEAEEGRYNFSKSDVLELEDEMEKKKQILLDHVQNRKKKIKRRS